MSSSFEKNWEQKVEDVKLYHVDTFVMGDDWEGKFDFQLRYPKTYGAWLSVQVGATATLSTYPIHGYRTVTLPTVADDFDKTNWAYTPSLDNTSPFGTLHTCK